MAKDLKRAQRKVGLIGAAGLPSLAVSRTASSNISAVTDQIGAHLQTKAVDEFNEEERLRGIRAGGQVTAIDENGQHKLLPNPTGTASYRKGFREASGIAYQANLKDDLSTKLNAIQINPDYNAEQKSEMMNAVFQGTLETIPQDFTATFGAWGTNHVLQRKNSMLVAEANNNKQLLYNEVSAAQDNEINEAISKAMTGGDPSQNLANAQSILNNLVDMNRMTQGEADAEFVTIQSRVMASSMTGNVFNRILDNRIDPMDAEIFGNALAGGGNATLAIAGTLHDGEISGEEPSLWSAKDIAEQVPDPRMRKLMGETIAKAAREQQARMKSYVDQTAFVNSMKTMGPSDELPQAQHKYLNEAISGLLQGKAMFDPTGRGQEALMNLTVTSKVVNKEMIRTLRNMTNSGDANQLLSAVAFYQKLREVKVGTADIGSVLYSRIDDKDRMVLDAAVRHITNGVSPENVMAGFELMNGPDAPVLSATIATFNTSESPDEKWMASISSGWSRHFDDLAMDQDFRKRVEEAFHFNFSIAGGDMQEVMDQTVDGVAKLYSKSEIFLKGYAPTRNVGLTNPEGFDDGLGDPNSWAKQNIQDRLEDLPLGLGEENRAITDLIQSGDMVLGENVFLVPTHTSLTDPQYKIFVDVDGTGPRVMMVPTNGDRVEPLVLDPSSDMNQLKKVIDYERQLDEYGDARDVQRKQFEKQFRSKAGGDLSSTDETADFESLSFQDWASKNMTPDQQVEWHDNMEGLKNNFDNAVNALGPEPTLRVRKVNPEHLLMPRYGGIDVTKAAINTIQEVLPDNTGGKFMLNIAAVESNFGRAKDAFRNHGDMGLFQINTGTYGGWLDMKRRAAIVGDPVWAANNRLKASKIGFDVLSATQDVLNTPIGGAAAARLFLVLRNGNRDLPTTVAAQAKWWKKWYNSTDGSGTEQGYIDGVEKIVLSPARKASKKRLAKR